MFFFRNVLKPTGGLDVLLWLREACLAAGMRTQTTSCYAQEHYERVLLGFGLKNRLNYSTDGSVWKEKQRAAHYD